MKNAKTLLSNLFLIFISLLLSNSIHAQCKNWMDSPDKEAAETAHVLYRQEVKNKNYDAAYDNWKKAYELAPAADGKRPSHYADGRKILKHKYDNETDEAKKKELAAFVIRLYDEQMECYANEAVMLGFKAYDMFYKFRSPYPETYEILKEAIKKGGKNSSYTVLDPMATIAVYLFTNKKMDKEEARAIHDQLMEIADHNINNGNKYAAQYKASKENVTARFAEIKYQIFDCEYFKNELKNEIEEAKKDPVKGSEMYGKLRQRHCADDDPLLMAFKRDYEQYAAAENAKRQAEFEANNPGMLAKKAYDAGDYKGAITKYDEAIAKETDPQKQATYYMSKASIQYRKLKSYSAAKSSCRKAASLRPDWGRPYMMIGDMYASGSRSCGDDWAARLAILAAYDKYAYAKSVDSSVAADAQKRMSKYRASFPDKEEAFMRKVTKGQKVSVPCWIGETVTIRFR
ncbi:MAG TPA: hypothetical protein ENI82_05595 [Bacteroidetes bacterium]|nr:hypothetical protein [Bacteroidota bacterium]